MHRFLFLLLIVFSSCVSEDFSVENSQNSAYFWKTVFRLDSLERNFVEKNGIKKLYVRYFDVVSSDKGLKPNATIRFKEIPKESLEIIPVVFIAENCLYKRLDTLYKTLADRILQINKTEKIKKCSEIQLDCDFTAKSMKNYYAFLTLFGNYLSEKGVKLSVTIRLHQLSMPAPPCCYGVLMLYNTGSFRDKKCGNPILSFADVKPYLKNLKKYPLPLSTAFPNFSWQILYGKNGFKNILYNQNLNDKTLFEEIDKNTYRVIFSKDVPIYMNNASFNVMLNKGDTISVKTAEFSEIEKTAREIFSLRKNVLEQVIIYDLNSLNINNLSNEEYEKIFNFPDYFSSGL